MNATNNSKHAIANRTTAISQYFIPLLGLIYALSGLSSISLHETMQLLNHQQDFPCIHSSQVFTDEAILITPARTCTKITYISLHTPHVLFVFLYDTDFCHCPIFDLSYVSYDQIHIYTQMRYVLRVSLIYFSI